MMVESAEKFPTATLISLLKLARRLSDATRGRFTFVFSSSDKLGAIGGLGALSGAKVLSVGDLSREATLTYLTAWGSPEDRAKGVYDVTGGHLVVLVDNEGMNLFCGGAIDQHELQTQLLTQLVLLPALWMTLLGVTFGPAPAKRFLASRQTS
jgi:hypothetical protein